MRLKFVDADGQSQREQVEGFCQFVRPSKALITFHKVSQPLALLGSDGERYWWMEVGGDQKRAFVGRHDHATPERIAAAGLRVHPLDLMDMLGLTPLPTESKDAKTAWSADGRALVVTLPGRMGVRRFTLDPESADPRGVDMLDASGRVLASSLLEKFERVSLKGAGPDVPRPRVPTKVVVEADGGATQIIMELSEPQDDPARFRPITFDFERLLEAHDVKDVRNLDEPGKTD